MYTFVVTKQIVVIMSSVIRVKRTADTCAHGMHTHTPVPGA